MNLVAGTRLGPYEIQSAIGAGGLASLRPRPANEGASAQAHSERVR